MKFKKKHLYIGLILVAAFFILFARRPESLTYPQFWAEDGRVWYANAQNFGVGKSLFLTQDGYFQTLPRLVAGLSTFVPMQHAPLVFNLIAILIELLPVWLLASGRLDGLIPSKKVRLLLIFLYLVLPNTGEIQGNLTNAQWFLALSACLILLAEGSRAWAWKIFDVFVVALSGLTGPFSIFLFPVAFFRWLKNRDTWALVLALVTLVAAFFQAMGIFILSTSSRLHTFPEVSARLFFAILNRQVFMGAIIGEKGYLWILANVPHYFWIFSALAVLSLILVLYAAWKAAFELKLFLFFALLVFVASLLTPTVADKSIPAWKVLSLSIAGARYWLIPMLAFVGCVVWNLRPKNYKVLRVLAGVFLAAMSIGIIMDWKHPKYVDYDFQGSAQAFKALPKGESLTIPINPPGWNMLLIKR